MMFSKMNPRYDTAIIHLNDKAGILYNSNYPKKSTRGLKISQRNIKKPKSAI